jgi:hypothetical protein
VFQRALEVCESLPNLTLIYLQLRLHYASPLAENWAERAVGEKRLIGAVKSHQWPKLKYLKCEHADYDEAAQPDDMDLFDMNKAITDCGLETDGWDDMFEYSANFYWDFTTMVNECSAFQHG